MKRWGCILNEMKPKKTESFRGKQATFELRLTVDG